MFIFITFYTFMFISEKLLNPVPQFNSNVNQNPADLFMNQNKYIKTEPTAINNTGR